jgi:hypothetical protein
MVTGDIDAALISEPYTHQSKISSCNIKGYRIIQPQSSGISPRAGIVLKHNVKYIEVSELQSRDTIAIIIESNIATSPKRIIVASIYQQPSYHQPPPTPQLIKIIEYAKNKQLPIIIGGDFNAHHTLWGSRKSNKQGEHLVSYLATTDLHLVNTGNASTFKSANGESIIDLTLCSRQISEFMANWKVQQEESLSDHSYISFNVQASPGTIQPKPNPRKTDWNKFTAKVRCKLTEPLVFYGNTQDIENSVQGLTQSINECFNETTRVPRKQRKKYNVWWSRELTELKKLTNRAKNKRAYSEENERAYREQRNKYTDKIRQAKREGFEKYTNNIEKLPEAQRLTKILEKGALPQPNMLKYANGEYTQSCEEAIQHLLDTHFPGNIKTHTVEQQQKKQTNTQERYLEANEIITETAVEWAINEFEPYKSPGPDDIYPIQLQKLLPYIKTHLTYIMRAVLAHGYIPISWRQSRVVFLAKPGKPTYDTAKSFRPISLSSFLLKTLERIIDRHLRDKALIENPIHQHQHAYQSGKSTETAAHALVTHIQNGIEHKQYVLSAFFDVQGAFDNAPTDVILSALKRRQAPDTIQNLVTSLLSSRQVTATLFDTSVTTRTTRGCPQGGVLSPLMWTMVMDDLLLELDKIPGIFKQAYADDGTIVIRGFNLARICQKMTTALECVNRWCQRNGLKISPEKTELVLFTKKRSRAGMQPITIGNNTLELRNEVKYLGIVLDEKLSFNSHIQQKCEKATRIVFQTRNAISKTWGFKPKIARWVYMTVVRPTLTYGAVTWWHRASIQTNRDKLSKVQRLAMLNVTRAMKTTPTGALEYITDIPPLDLYIHGEAMNATIRLNSWGAWPKNETFALLNSTEANQSILETTELALGTKIMNIDKTRPTIIIKRNFTKWTSHDDCTYDCHVSTHTHISNRTTVGSAFTLSYHGIQAEKTFTLNGTTSQGELIAIRELLLYIRKQQITDSTIRINMSNQTEHTLETETRLVSKLKMSCMNLLNDIGTQNTVMLASIELNLAEELAKNASKLQTDTKCPLSSQKAKNKVRELVCTMQNHRLNTTSTMRMFKSLSSDPDIWRNLCLYKHETRDLAILTRIYTGHAPLEKHLYTMRIGDNSLCDDCETTDGTVEHFLLECSEYEAEREATLGNKSLPMNTALLSINRTKLLSFIKLTKKFD